MVSATISVEHYKLQIQKQRPLVPHQYAKFVHTSTAALVCAPRYNTPTACVPAASCSTTCKYLHCYAVSAKVTAGTAPGYNRRLHDTSAAFQPAADIAALTCLLSQLLTTSGLPTTATIPSGLTKTPTVPRMAVAALSKPQLSTAPGTFCT